MKGTLAHFVTLDIEGLDYEILGELVTGRIFAQNGVIFCQVMHSFTKFLRKIR